MRETMKLLESMTPEEARQRLVLCEDTLALSDKKIATLCKCLRAQHASTEAIRFAETALALKRNNKTREANSICVIQSTKTKTR